MATKKATATVNPVNPVDPATVTVDPATVENKNAKINLKKEGKNTINTNENKTATAPVSAPVSAPAPAVAPATATAPVVTVDPVTVKRAEIGDKIKIAKIRYMAYKDVNQKGESINPTNWGKTETGTGKETLGGYVRTLLSKTLEEIDGLKRELKATYFTLEPEIKALLDSENPVLVSVANNCIENMRNVPVIKNAESLTADVVKMLASAGVKNVGIDPLILGVTLPVLITNGYIYDPTSPQPITLPEKKIEGLDVVPACTYYNFKLA